MQSIVSLIAILPFVGCILENKPASPPGLKVLEITKWYNGYTSAFTPTYDTPILGGEEMEWLKAQGLHVDLEVVTGIYDRAPGKMDSLKALAANNFGYFGHGHEHIDHDELDYGEALESFSTNFGKMVSAGLNPVAYAYPNGSGFKESTLKAVKDAGFLSARMAWHFFDTTQPYYVMPDSIGSPKNWYQLPALYMQSFGFMGCWSCIKTTEEFSGYLEQSIQHGAWLINVYHAIGMNGKDKPLGWGYYELEDFYGDMLMAKTFRDQGILWIASLADVTLYVQSRNVTRWKVEASGRNTYRLHLTNDLDKSRFNHKLSVRLEVENRLLGKTMRVLAAGSTTPVLDTLVTHSSLLINLVPAELPYEILFL